VHNLSDSLSQKVTSLTATRVHTESM